MYPAQLIPRYFFQSRFLLARGDLGSRLRGNDGVVGGHALALFTSPMGRGRKRMDMSFQVRGVSLSRSQLLTRAHRAARNFARPLPMGEVQENMPHGLAASLPEGFKERRERGRRSTAILSRHRAAFRRPRRLLAVPGVRSHRQRAHRSSPAFCRTSRVHDLERLRTDFRCAAADGRPCVLLPSRTAPIAGPGM
jgi:hypothetical protein